jgi:hypothetical protein
LNKNEIKKHRTYYKNFHRGFGKGTAEGNIREQLDSIRVLVHKWPDDVLISVRDLKEIFGNAKYYLSEDQIRKLSREGFLQGRKFNSRFWYYPKSSLYSWITYLQEVGLRCLMDKGIIEEEQKR